MTTQPAYTVSTADWASDEAAIFAVRKSVFVDEQHVDPQLEWDGRDTECTHVLAHDADNHAIGTGRLLTDGHVGRMAVRPEWRGNGVGGAILRALIGEAHRKGFVEVHLNAQVHAIEFYRKAGFRLHGKEFMDAGMPHHAMLLKLER
ncbi:MAG: GNAT family N-acetyltransferase [Gammaproteobacteria bacterium]|nr:GNAT family N-acetyltransferase [Gammaproteobacteria bacterium]